MPERFSWDNFNDDDSVLRFDVIGKVIIGTIVDLKVVNFGQGDIPELHLVQDDGVVRKLSVGQTQLKRKLAGVDLQAGDRVKLTYERDEPLGGGRTLKHFDVQIKKATTNTEVPPPAAPMPTPSVAVAAAAADDDIF